jgi:hypothetical protein
MAIWRDLASRYADNKASVAEGSVVVPWWPLLIKDIGRPGKPAPQVREAGKIIRPRELLNEVQSGTSGPPNHLRTTESPMPG